MDIQNLIVITDKSVDDCHYIDGSVFSASYLRDPAQLLQWSSVNSHYALLVLDLSHNFSPDCELLERVRDIGREIDLPLVMMYNGVTLEQKLQVLNAGFKDVISPDQPVDEITTRFLREIYHNIANQQLKQQLDSASYMAQAAMRESSYMGSNVHFLVQAHQCSNLDELGQVFFQTMNKYGLNCSLQMRSIFGDKNMEANGMPRQLESELLTQLKNAGRYYDFGPRTIVNYGCISVLIRNMPTDEALYELVKDNTLTLLQGLDARVRSLDQQRQLMQEKAAMELLSVHINEAMQNVNIEYQQVMLAIVEVVENMAERIAARVPLLLLNEEQEHFIEQTVTDCVLNANKVFNEGFKVDRYFNELRQEIENAIAQIRQDEEVSAMLLARDQGAG